MGVRKKGRTPIGNPRAQGRIGDRAPGEKTKAQRINGSGGHRSQKKKVKGEWGHFKVLPESSTSNWKRSSVVETSNSVREPRLTKPLKMNESWRDVSV